MPNSVFYIVDDDPVFSTIFDKLLRHNHYNRILQFSSGEECLDRLQQVKELPSLIFLDFSMKGLDGLSVLKKIKSLYSEIKVAIVTSIDDEELREKCILEGAYMYINKRDIATKIPALYSEEKPRFNNLFDFKNLNLN